MPDRKQKPIADTTTVAAGGTETATYKFSRNAYISLIRVDSSTAWGVHFDVKFSGEGDDEPTVRFAANTQLSDDFPERSSGTLPYTVGAAQRTLVGLVEVSPGDTVTFTIENTSGNPQDVFVEAAAASTLDIAKQR
jgi:hypothetical protein